MEAPADEIKHLRACINDLISVLALPALWSGRGPPDVLGTLLDALLGMLRLDFAYARLDGRPGGPPIEVFRSVSAGSHCVPNPVGDWEVSTAHFQLGLDDEAGVLVAGSQRGDFPTKVELLVLRVATNQAGIGLREARLLDQQRLERQHAEEEGRTLAVLVERSPDFIGMATPDGQLIFINPAGRRMIGLKTGEALGSTRMVDCIAEDDRERFLSQVLPSLARDERWEGEIRFRDLRTGATIPILQNAFVIKEPGADRPRILATIGRDITEQRRDEMALRAAQAELAHVAREGIERDVRGRGLRAELGELRRRYESLTPRERAVMTHVVAGLLNKQVASALGISEITVKVHRARIMQKMRVGSLAELVRNAEKLGVSAPPPEASSATTASQLRP